MTKRQDINYLQYSLDSLEATFAKVKSEASDLREKVRNLTAGIETKYEVTTVGRSDIRKTRTMTNRFDALNYASGLRIEGESVLLYEVESRRRALYPNGTVIGRWFA